MSSAFKSGMERLFLSAAVKKMLVRLVSTLTISSESCGTSSRRGVGDGDAIGIAPGVLASFFADKLRLATPAHKSTKTKNSNSIGRLYCIITFKFPYGITLSAIAL
jgi:hypothetical protein